MQSTTIEVLTASEYTYNEYIFCHLANAVQSSTGIIVPPDDYSCGDYLEVDGTEKLLLNARFGGHSTDKEIFFDVSILATTSMEEKVLRFTSEFTETVVPTSFPEAFHSVVLYLKEIYQNEEQEMALACFAGYYGMWEYTDYMYEILGALEDCSLEILNRYEEWLKTRQLS
jgi:hypothetical protein